jgi:uncharacterized protein (DUF2252 family)
VYGAGPTPFPRANEEVSMTVTPDETKDQQAKRAAKAARPALDGPAAKVPHLTVPERIARGKAARAESPRTGHAELSISKDRDPVALLEEQTPSRVPDLVPIRYGRMLVSPFAFYRGGANIMAHDLAPTPRAGLTVQLCGDAHLSNFGGFASPDRSLVLDLNDFDETLPGPFEWDVKRLAASFEIAGRDRGFSEDERRLAVLESLRAYRDTMRQFAAERNLDVWYARLDLATAIDKIRAEAAKKKQVKRAEKAAAKGQTKDSMRAFAKLTEVVDGKRRIISDPPLIVPLSELTAHLDAAAVEAELLELFRSYRRTLQPDRRKLLEGFRFVDIARKVVGVGSVGTRAWIMLLLGRDDEDPLFIQVKEAQASVLEKHLGKSAFKNHGERVVEGQRMMQAASDIFLGWIRNPKGLDGASHDFYVRQLWDWKTSFEIEAAVPQGLALYAGICGSILARAHARNGDRVAIAAYLGKSDVFDRAVAEFAVAYADQNEKDYQALADAVRGGRIAVEEGI